MQDQPSPVQTHQVEFKGTGSEYFRIWIVNILLTICTLYIYSAWAKVRTRRYFYGNTVIDGSSFEYHATGKQLLLGQLVGLILVALVTVGQSISVALTIAGIVFLALLFPWAVCRSQQFNARMSSYRNVRFGFSGEAKKYYKYLLVAPLLAILVFAGLGALASFAGASEAVLAVIGSIAVVALYAMYPWIHGKLMAYTINRSQFGVSEFKGDIKAGKVMRFYLKAFLLSLCVLALTIGLVIAAVIGLSSFDGVGAAASELANDLDPESPVFVGIGLAIYALVIPLGILVKSYLESRLRNYQYNNTSIDGNFELSSTVTTGKLWWLKVSNLLLLLCTLGLAYPWVAVRTARFMANNTQVIAKQSADLFIDQQAAGVSAVGDGLGDAFDMDIAVGL